MESITPPYHQSDPKTQTKSASRLARISQFTGEESPNLSLELVPSSPKITSPSNTLSPKPQKLHELLLLSPSPHRKSRTRPAERLEMAYQDPADPNGSRRRCKTRNSAGCLLNCASPRNNRRSRRRFEQEIREERELVFLEEMGKPKKRQNGGRSKKERLISATSIPSPGNDGDSCNLDRIGQLITDLIMWNDVAKSSLWFGFGLLGFLSSCFARGVSFSIFSMMSQLGLLVLGVAFFSNSICQRDNTEIRRDFKLKEDDIVKAARVVLPAANLAICKTRELFSGDPSVTLKVAPFLLLGAEYGHLITLWRFCALGFFLSFTGPKLYSFYSVQINEKGAAYLRRRVLEAWGVCSHKKIVAASAATAFWNLTSFKTRIFAAFISLVLARYHRQYSETKEEERETEEPQQEQQLALVLVANGSHE